jgi:hypothetical protein
MHTKNLRVAMLGVNNSSDGRNGESPTFALSPTWTWLVVAVGLVLGLGGILVWAEEHQLWYVAQGTLIAILLLSALVGWIYYRSTLKTFEISTEAKAYNRGIRRLRSGLAIGYFALLVNAIRHDRWQCGTVARALGYGTLVAGVAFITGVLLGLLFGFRPTSQSSAARSSSVLRHPYTNLEEIADWLTKIILGAGLVELTNLVHSLPRFAEYMARGVEPVPPVSPSCPVAQEASPPIALAIMGFFFASGILYGYLWSRWEFALASGMQDTDTPTAGLGGSLVEPADTSK